MQQIHHLIGGERAAATGKTLDITNPATGQAIRQVADADAATVAQAIDVAKAAFPAWRDTPPAKRAQVMFRFKQLLEDNAEYACGVPELLKGEYLHNAGPGIDAWSNFQPLGVVAGITPFNFPAMIPPSV